MPLSRLSRWTTALAAILAASLPTTISHAQLNPGGRLVLADPATPDGAPHGGVYVYDSAVAVDKMALAERLERLKEWTKSAEVYQEITEKYRDRVVPLNVDADGVVDQFTSVLTLVNRHLQTWPEEGLAVYRTQYELTARKLLESAHGDDLSPLHAVFNQYFVTESGKQAGLRLVDAYFELGEFPAAAWISQELLKHPTLLAERPKVLFRLGLAAHMSGDEPTAQKTLAELKNNFANAIGTIDGHDVTLADSLAGYLSKPPPSALGVAAGAGDSWPMLGGDVSRGKIESSNARMGAELYSIALSAPNWKAIPDPSQRQMLESNDLGWRHDGAATGVMPVADHGELFFQDNARIYGVNLQSGEPLPGWLSSYPDQNGQFVFPKAWSMPNGHAFPLTVTDGVVVAVMDQPEPLVKAYQLATGLEPKVVCLDRRTGRQIWVFGAHQLPDDALKAVIFDGSPLVVGNNVYLAGHQDKANGYQDSYVLCLDLSSGTFRWSSYVASAPSMSQPVQNLSNQQITFDVSSHLSYASGRVFVSTNLGAVAALDAYGGTVAWLDIYRETSDVINPNMIPMGGFGRRFGGFQQQIPTTPFNLPRPWTINAPIVRDGMVFVLPTDGKYILVYDAGDGHVVKQIKKEDCLPSGGDEAEANSNSITPTEPSALLGVLDGATVNDQGKVQPEDVLLLGTASHIVAINWRGYNPDNPRASFLWATENPSGAIRGRAFVTADSVYVPTLSALDRVSVRNGAVVESYPPQGSWPAGEASGNIMVCGDEVVIAGDQRVSVYSDLKLVRENLDRQVAAAGNDPESRLRYAEVMFVANQADVAADKLDEAAKLLDQDNTPGANQLRNRAFNDAMTFAKKSWQDNAKPDHINRLFDRASDLARTPGQKVKYRLDRGQYAVAGQHDVAAAVSLYQGILADSALRVAAAPRPPDLNAMEGDQWQAGRDAERAIQLLLQDSQGRSAYQPFEQAARNQYAAAKKANNPDALLNVAVIYPNSTIAPQARREAAETFDAKGQFADAARTWRDLYGDLTDQSQKLIVLEKMAADYLNVPGRLDAAASRLDAARKLNGLDKMVVALKLPDGQQLSQATVREAADSVDKLAAQAPAAGSENLPTLALPPSSVEKAYVAKNHGKLWPFMPEDAVATIANVGVLLAPDQLNARNDRLATWTNGRGISIFPVGQAKPIGVDGDIDAEPRGTAWVNHRANLLTWSAGGLSLLDGDHVTTRWRIDLSSLDDLDVMAQSVAPTNYVSLIVPPMGTGRRGGGGRAPLMLTYRASMHLQALVSSGSALNDAAVSSGSTSGDEEIADVTPLANVAVASTSAGRLIAVDLANGAILWQYRIEDHVPDRVVANDDFTVVKASDDSAVRLVIFDTHSGRMLASRAFRADPASIGQTLDGAPINIALGEDGTLAYTDADRMTLRDLYEIASDFDLQNPQSRSEDMPGRLQAFAGMTRPEQLLSHDRQVLAVESGGRTMSVFSAEIGQLRRYTNPDITSQGSQLMRLATGSGAEDTTLHISGAYVYAWGQHSLAAYNLESPDMHWDQLDLHTAAGQRQMFFGRDYLLLMNELPAAGGAAVWEMQAFSRALVSQNPANESGRFVYESELTAPGGILSWQPVEGGLCYLAGDHTLHFLRGNPTGAQEKP